MKHFPTKIKRTLALVLALLCLTGCGSAAGETSPTETASETPVQPDTQPATEVTTPAETEPDLLEGDLYLKVSAITFTLAGESEDIYLGVVPRELVTWESEDPEIISVEGGVLTAVSVGTTVIHATYEDRSVSCQAGCLAQTQEELDALDWDIRSQPKWLPPEVDMTQPCTWFDNAAIVGDSITYGLMQNEASSNGLGNMLFLARGGVSIMGFIQRNKNIIFQGLEMELEDIIAQTQVERVYFLMGSNDIAAKYEMDVMMDNWAEILDRIWEKSPGVEIVLISSLPKCVERPYLPISNSYNEITLQYNAALREFAREQGVMYLDLASYIQDHWGRLSPEYNIDETHLNELGCQVWMQVLRYYAQFESEGGILE